MLPRVYVKVDWMNCYIPVLEHYPVYVCSGASPTELNSMDPFTLTPKVILFLRIGPTLLNCIGKYLLVILAN